MKPEGIDETAGLLSEGFAELSVYLKQRGGDEEFARIVEKLKEIGTDDAKMYAEQMLTARKVFEPVKS